MIIDLKRSLDWRLLFDPVLLFILRWSCFIPICLNSSPSPVRKCITREKVKLFISVLILSARLLARKLFLPYFTLIIINKRAPPPPPIRDFNNNTTDHNEEVGRFALIWWQIINKRAPPLQVRDHPLFAVLVSLICGGSLWAVVVVKFHRVINNTTWYYDQSYTIMTLCKHGLVDGGVQ